MSNEAKKNPSHIKLGEIFNWETPIYTIHSIWIFPLNKYYINKHTICRALQWVLWISWVYINVKKIRKKGRLGAMVI